jgi:hypothetical protein
MNGSRFSKGLLLLCAIALLFGAAVPYGASAAESGDQPASFKDLRSSYWAYNDIMELAALNIVSGFTDGTFRPNDDITREQFLKILVELVGFPTDSRDVPFRDVAPTRWSVPHIAAGVAHGILDVRDYPDGFKPDQPITRLEMAIWIVRALKLEPQTEETMLMTLKDQAEIRSRRELIEAALRTGIIRGYPDGTFKGGNQSTRAEAAAMAVRALRYLRNQPSSPGSGTARKIVEYLPNVKMGKSKRYYKRDDRTWVIEDPDLHLSPGDVFVMPPNDEFFGGIAKKVVSVREENGALVVTTSVPRVREVFARLEVRTTEAIDPRLLVPADPSIEIAESPAPAPVRLASVQPAALQLPCFIIRMSNARYDGFALDAGINFCNLGVDADIGLDVDVDCSTWTWISMRNWCCSAMSRPT